MWPLAGNSLGCRMRPTFDEGGVPSKGSDFAALKNSLVERVVDPPTGTTHRGSAHDHSRCGGLRAREIATTASPIGRLRAMTQVVRRG
jgi:hypothetical protein